MKLNINTIVYLFNYTIIYRVLYYCQPIEKS